MLKPGVIVGTALLFIIVIIEFIFSALATADGFFPALVYYILGPNPILLLAGVIAGWWGCSSRQPSTPGAAFITVTSNALLAGLGALLGSVIASIFIPGVHETSREAVTRSLQSLWYFNKFVPEILWYAVLEVGLVVVGGFIGWAGWMHQETSKEKEAILEDSHP